MLKPSKYLTETIRTQIAKDLDPPTSTVQLKLGVACTAGSLFSLLVCGQFGVAFTPMAHTISSFVHSNMHPLVCAAICGTAYSLFPVAVLRLFLTSPLQFRAIVKNHRYAIAGWYVGSGLIMAAMGHHGNDVPSITFWMLAAVLGAQMSTLIASAMLPSWNLRDELAQ